MMWFMHLKETLWASVELRLAVQKIRCSLDMCALWTLCFQLMYNTL